MTVAERILILLVLVRAMPGLEQLSCHPALDPRVAEYVWFDTDNSNYMWDKEEEVRTVMSIPNMLPTAMESLPEQEKQSKQKDLKTLIRLR